MSPAGEAPRIKVEPPWWERFRLQTTLADPPVHTLTRDDDRKIALTAADFLSVKLFSAKFLDAMGHLPPWPAKGRGAFLEDIVTYWFERRETVRGIDEASVSGILAVDIHAWMQSAPESEDGGDLSRGAIVRRGPAGALFSARACLEYVHRRSPVRPSPREFFDALTAIGCENQGVVRIGLWRGRAWLAPPALLEPEPEGAPSYLNGGHALSVPLNA